MKVLPFTDCNFVIFFGDIFMSLYHVSTIIILYGICVKPVKDGSSNPLKGFFFSRKIVGTCVIINVKK